MVERGEDAATQLTTQEEHAATEGASMEEQAAAEEASVEEQAAAYGTHKNDGNTHKGNGVFVGAVAALRMSYICTPKSQ